MAAQLNIKDPVLIERARELAARRGQPVTTTLRSLVDGAWEADSKDRDRRRAELDQLIAEIRADMPEDVKKMTSKEIMDSIYDDDEPDGFAR